MLQHNVISIHAMHQLFQKQMHLLWDLSFYVSVNKDRLWMEFVSHKIVQADDDCWT